MSVALHSICGYGGIEERCTSSWISYERRTDNGSEHRLYSTTLMFQNDFWSQPIFTPATHQADLLPTNRKKKTTQRIKHVRFKKTPKFCEICVCAALKVVPVSCVLERSNGGMSTEHLWKTTKKKRPGNYCMFNSANNYLVLTSTKIQVLEFSEHLQCVYITCGNSLQ